MGHDSISVDPTSLAVLGVVINHEHLAVFDESETAGIWKVVRLVNSYGFSTFEARIQESSNSRRVPEVGRVAPCHKRSLII